MTNYFKKEVNSLYFNQANNAKNRTRQMIIIKIVFLLVVCLAVFFITISVIPIIIGLFVWFALYGFGYYVVKWDVY